MNVCLTDDQKLLQQTVREFAEAELRPHVMEWDDAQAFPREMIDKLAALGLMGIQFPEQYGGSAMSAVNFTAPQWQAPCLTIPRAFRGTIW